MAAAAAAEHNQRRSAGSPIWVDLTDALLATVFLEVLLLRQGRRQ